jgi:AcrR family transcriptional regulator
MSTETRSYTQRHRAELRADTRKRILAAARELIPTVEESLSVTRIARHAGVAIQTIYDQFGSKGGLLIATIEDAQRSLGLFDQFGHVFRSPHGEEAMRRMNEATVRFWAGAWPFVESMLGVRRTDAVVKREMEFVDRLRHAHYWAITQRLADEGRLRAGRTADWAADQSFALTIPNVYEELAVRRSTPLAGVIETINEAVLDVILEPGTPPVTEPPPDWRALEDAAAQRAKESGADPSRLTPTWQSTR